MFITYVSSWSAHVLSVFCLFIYVTRVSIYAELKFITLDSCLVHTGGFCSIIKPPQFQVGQFVQLYHEAVNPKGFDASVVEVIDTRRRLGVYEYTVEMESQKIWIPEQFLQGAWGNGGHGSRNKRKRRGLGNGSPTKACLTPNPTAAIAALLKNEKQTTPPTLLNTPSGETTPGASTSVESKVFAALIVPDVIGTQRELVFTTQPEAVTFTQQSQDTNKLVSVSDLVVKESKVAPDISFLKLSKKTGQGLFMPENFTGLKFTDDVLLCDSTLTTATTIRGTWMFDYAIQDRVRPDCVWVPACTSVSNVSCKVYKAQHSLNPSHKIVQDRHPGDAASIRLVCIRPLGPGDEITYFYGNRLYVMTGIGPGPARTVKTNAGPKLHDEVQITRTSH